MDKNHKVMSYSILMNARACETDDNALGAWESWLEQANKHRRYFGSWIFLQRNTAQRTATTW